MWNVNATATGGGVAEMLQALLSYVRAADVNTRWLVLDGDQEFFKITKRVHNFLHGSEGDGGSLGPEEKSHFLDISHTNGAEACNRAEPGDIVLLHDPQTAGMVTALRERDMKVVWRCHIGADTTNSETDTGWSFLRDLVEPADAFIFSRREYAPDWVPRDKLWIIPPSLGPFSAKNHSLSEADVIATLRRAGLVDASDGEGAITFARRGGAVGEVRPHEDLLVGERMLPQNARIVMQVSRWDRLKDMEGVMRGFVDHVADVDDDVHLLLVGPDVAGVTDDPEGAEVLEECISRWKDLSESQRSRVHLCCLPMDDVDENAHIVNALQRHATIVVQKSLVEGFGLTVTEPMWKAKPVVASAIGGIQDQIEDGVSGILLPDPQDLDEFAKAVGRLLDDPRLAESIGKAAQERVRDRYLPDRHLTQYIDLFETLITS